MKQEQIPQIVISLEDGIIINIDSDLPVRVFVLDFDDDVRDDSKKLTFTDTNGKKHKAVVTLWEEKHVHFPEISEHIFKQLYKPE